MRYEPQHLALLVDHIDILRTVMRKVKTTHPFRIYALVVLPNHLHAIWTLPEDDADYPTRWALIKAGFSRCLGKDERRNPSRIAKGERGIWQRRYWEHLIRDERDSVWHVDYIHYNPVKHGYVSRVKDWPHSTFHRAVERGDYPSNWAAPAERNALDSFRIDVDLSCKDQPRKKATGQQTMSREQPSSSEEKLGDTTFTDRD